MFEDKQRSEVEQLGKFGLIDKLSAKFPTIHETSYKGLKEDASVLKNGKNYSLLASRLFLENIHFDLAYFPLKHLGYKCVAVALSDIVAMNALPTQIRVNIAISNRFSLEAMDELTEGMRACCQRYEIDLVGLDVQASPTGLVIAIDAMGEVTASKLALRESAKEKELLCVSGDLGAAYTGLILLEREKKVFEANPENQPDLDGYDYLLERQLKPEPRVDIIKELQKNKIMPTAMINLSDGLASALMHLCKNSNLGCTIYESKIPIDVLAFNTLKEMKLVATTVALSGGEDYEVLFTIKQEDFEKVNKIENITVIGYMEEVSAGYHLITNDDKAVQIKAQGFSQ